MERATVTLNERGHRRVMVLNRVERGGLTGEEAARLMDLSLRQARRLFGSLQEEGGYCPGPWQSRPSAGPPDIRGYQEVGRGPGSRYIPRVELLRPAGGSGTAGGAGTKPVFAMAHPHRGKSRQAQAVPAASAPPPQRAVSPGGDVALCGRQPGAGLAGKCHCQHRGAAPSSGSKGPQEGMEASYGEGCCPHLEVDPREDKDQRAGAPEVGLLV